MGQMVYRAGIIGCGKIGCLSLDDSKKTGIWTHAGVYAESARTELVAIADPQKTILDACRERWLVPNTYLDFKEMIEKENLDVVSICTPSNLHIEVLMKCIPHVRAVFCEKPISLSVEEGFAMVRACKDRVLAINHTRRWEHCYKLARQRVRSDSFGAVSGAHCWYSGGISNMGTHVFDTLRFLLGEAEWVWAAPARSDNTNDPNLSGAIGFGGGFVCTLTGTSTGERMIFEIDVVGANERLRICDNGRRAELSKYTPSRQYSGYKELGPAEIIYDGQDDLRLLSALEDILDCIDSNRQPSCSGLDGVKAVEMVAAFLIALERQCFVKLPLNADDQSRIIPVR